MNVSEMGRLLRARKLSCVELLKETLRDIKQRDVFHSFITLTEDSAWVEATARDREFAEGIDRGPFHGIPTAYKDLFYTKGVRTTGGSLLFRDFVPDYDATVVELLTRSGAVSLGKANLHELAYGISSKNPHYGFVLNPHDTSRIPGGSSGGSAALVGAGLLPMSMGSDTGGSIRIPASFCGVVGLKPTYGRVSRHGVMPLAFSLDCVGPIGATVKDCALTMNAIAGQILEPTEFNLEAARDLQGVRVGVPKNFFFERVDVQVAKAVRDAIAAMERLGASLVEVKIPDLNEVNALARIVQFSETAALYAAQTDPNLFGADVWPLLQQGKLVAGHEYVNAQRLRTLYRRDFNALWGTIDVLAAPTTPIAAPRLDETTVKIGSSDEDTRIACTRLVRAINYLGEPALSMPCGKTAEGMPVGLQLVSKPFSEPALLRIARTLERESGSFDRTPASV
jgi:aspartyl-tRNA(Asn)/glutamyl-tRNA(Gln) amidotransferase subunit A